MSFSTSSPTDPPGFAEQVTEKGARLVAWLERVVRRSRPRTRRRRRSARLEGCSIIETVLECLEQRLVLTAVPFTEHAVSTNADRASSVFAADVDGDGDTDLVSASYNDDKIAWYENTAGDGSAFTAHTVSTNADGAFSVFAADVDGDGDIDLLSASRFDGKIAWYENTAEDGSAFTDAAAVRTCWRFSRMKESWNPSKTMASPNLCEPKNSIAPWQQWSTLVIWCCSASDHGSWDPGDSLVQWRDTP